jgi:ABC-type bacteriocin/lantibiotic exporter with double-glycine peptidase domain
VHTLKWLVLVFVAVLGSGCSVYQGSAKAAEPAALAREGDWTMIENFPLVRQVDDDDCGGAALASVLRFWGVSATPESVEAAIGRVDRRLSAGDMADHARSKGLRAFVIFGTMDDVLHELDRGRPVIVGVGKKVVSGKALAHYEVVVGYEKKKQQVLTLDPGQGWQVNSVLGFAEEWARSGGVTIVTFLPADESKVATSE